MYEGVDHGRTPLNAPPLSAKRGPQLSRERVVQGAVSLTDQYGVGSLTIRSLAAYVDVISTIPSGFRLRHVGSRMIWNRSR